jgi:hypothetical protein
LGPKKAVLRGRLFPWLLLLPFSSIIRDLFLEWHP